MRIANILKMIRQSGFNEDGTANPRTAMKWNYLLALVSYTVLMVVFCHVVHV